jgi:hypothetical protein
MKDFALIEVLGGFFKYQHLYIYYSVHMPIYR